MSDDEMKTRVLARRAKFIAAAVAGLVACEPGPDAQPPNVCLSISLPPPEDGSTGPTIVDAGASADPDASWSSDASTSAQDADVPPMPCLAPPLPCLSVVPTPPPPQTPKDAGVPRPCLKPMPPPKPAPTSAPKPPPPRVCLSFSGGD